jgi:hypothetical protein
MSTSTKAIIAIVSIIILISGIFIITKSRPVENITSSNSSVSSMSFSSKAVLSSSSQVVSSPSQVVSKVVEITASSVLINSTSQISTLPNTETIDSIQVTYLDSKNPPQYIKDYLACSTKDEPIYTGMFGLLENKIIYNCAPTDLNKFSCPEGTSEPFVNSEGWPCVIRRTEYGMECDIAIENIINNSETVSTLKSNYIKARSIPIKNDTLSQRCLIFSKTKLSNAELKAIAKYNSNFKIINYSN